jgi:hypothetical protein
MFLALVWGIESENYENEDVLFWMKRLFGFGAGFYEVLKFEWKFT